MESHAREIVDSAFRVHQQIGPGLLESIYEKCLMYEFRKRGLKYENQVILPIEYDGEILDGGLRIDLKIEGKILIEIKAIESLLPIHEAQILPI
jgi:GxxExxY protein